jgi:V/A-type H+-transporting ATPase subunit E
MAEERKIRSGVQELINKLRDDGVKAGEEEAERRVKKAKDQANMIISEAKAEAERLVHEAKVASAAEQERANEAIKVAFRNTRLELQSGLEKAFENHVKRLVSKEVRDEEFLRRLLLSIVGSAAAEIPQDQPFEVTLPEKIFETDPEATDVPEEWKERIRNFVRRGTSEILRDGVELVPSTSLRGGIQLRLKEEDVIFDFSEQALSDVIVKHLLPRYRAIVEGIE